MARKPSLFTVLQAIVITIALLMVLIPLLYLFLNSIKIGRDFESIPPNIIPTQITFSHYASVFAPGSDLVSDLINSVIVALAVVALSVVTGSMAAFGLARLRRIYRLAALVVYLILLVRFYPKVVLIIPYFVLMRDVHLLDTLSAVVIAQSSIGIPFVVWLMLGFFDEIPPELEESAMLDGCGTWQRFSRIVFPIVLPGVATAAIMTAILSWNEFLITSSVVSVNAQTLPVLVSTFITDKGISWGKMAATSSVIIFPMFVFVLFTQRYLVRGMTFGAVKG